MNLEEIKKNDTKNMFGIYDKWSEIAQQNFQQEFSRPELKEIDHVIFAGMGGSGTVGDIFSSILSKNDIHTSVVKGYLLPKTVDSNTLIVIDNISKYYAVDINTGELVWSKNNPAPFNSQIKI